MLSNLWLSEVADICNGQLIGADGLASSVSTDSRDIDDQAIFVALKGDTFDGHDFASKALEGGFLAVLVDRDLGTYPAIIVEDTLKAYGDIAHYVREQFAGGVVAITGSNGKTTVKEWLSQILSQDMMVLKTQKNENNQIGVPKTLLNLENNHQAAIIETGTSYPGEIVKMGAVIAPSVAIITNASGCHYTGFGTLEAIAQEKGSLLSSVVPDGTVVLNRDDPFYSYWEGLSEGRQIRTFGFQSNADLYVDELVLSADYSSARFHYDGVGLQAIVGSPGKHQIANAMAVVQTLIALGWEFVNAVNALSTPLIISGRLQKITASNRPLLLNDCYNASPKSVSAAIDVLMSQKANVHVLVLGALGELGSLETEVHQEIGRNAYDSGVKTLIALGPVAGIAVRVFIELGGQGHIFDTHAEIASNLKELDDSFAILIKGSRSSQMEKVIEKLHY